MDELRDIGQLLSGMTAQGVFFELVGVAACLGLAYTVVRWWRGEERPRDSIWFGERIYDGVLFPLLALLMLMLARFALKQVIPIALLELATPIIVSLMIIRLSVRVLRVGFPTSLLVRRLERSVLWLVWIGLVMWLTGLLPLLMREMERFSWRIGGVDMTLLSLLQGALSALAVLLGALWISSTVEASLLKGVTGPDISARKIAANGMRAVLLLVGLLLALSAAGIPLSALSVLGGAFGVGIGLGLQKIAANYVSGFVILAEHALRIGDMVKVDGFEGRITDIKARYTVIRSLAGRESIVPNDMLITQRVENSSLADRNVVLSTKLQVAYGTDVRQLLPLLAEVAAAVPRVLAQPGPSVQLSSFADSGLELTLLFWIADPENGQGNVTSEVNLALLAALNAQGVEIPFPQRVVRLLGDDNAGASASVPASLRPAEG
ncbi:MAG: mechanosensitive ion channel domain-containing protein [Rubrivivax sp.]